MHKTTHNLRVGPLGEGATWLTELQALEFSTSNSKALTAEVVQTNSGCDEVSAWLVWCER